MSVFGNDRFVIDPTDVRGAGFDEWAAMTGVRAGSPLLGGAGFAGYPGMAGAPDLGSFTTVVDGTPAMPGGAPASQPARARWNDWRELFDPHSPALWLLIFTIFATSLVHFRIQGALGRAHASGGIG